MKTPVRYNHVGYTPEASKTFFVDVKAFPCQGSFCILDDQEKIVYEGSLTEGSFGHRGVCDYSGETLWTGDFSAVTVPGKYCISVAGKSGADCRTEYFEVSNSWIGKQVKANIKSFFYQRSGVELPEEFAGKWARPAAHLDDNIGFHCMMEREGTWNAHGGWYDAGDYGKYIVNGGISVGTLLLACQIAPEAEAVNVGGSFEQPYSLKDELRFELDFFLRMQDHDGGVFFKVTPEHWDGFISPRDSDLLQKRLVLGKSTTSTLNFAGALAQASCVFRKEDETFADHCLDASVAAYRWAVKNPAADWPHNTEGSGGYGDEHYDDEFFWARAALFCALDAAGRNCDPLFDEVRKMLPADMEKNPAALGMDWRDTQNMGWNLLALQDIDADLQKSARKTLEGVVTETLRLQKEDAYGLSIRRFIWGSNGEVANHALTMLVVDQWKKDAELRAASLEMMNFVYGRNPVNTCFVTGAAWSSPKHPHHRLSHSDGVAEPIPGLVVGGINCDRQDGHRAPHYPGDLPGLSYTDERCSFASNETAINWSSPLTAVLLLLS
ncbi:MULTISPECIES: glycoside hydrolase family 9 protein [unclassified Fibrobacter]|uniref:glycoside hydrolase family 9 protein n=1 Tax=unclassified Fibrobacter TaxID=2634177 RepID=UPI000D6C412D|nr:MULTISPECIES: glycoside hydrolase family 9 protein [unclassified Fibrobacter]PWJ71839.1 endoglucanase [Fibrobacter sp. UWR4]PZW73754.1 endoglucanase [Fibrobacter sp. UWR1]